MQFLRKTGFLPKKKAFFFSGEKYSASKKTPTHIKLNSFFDFTQISKTGVILPQDKIVVNDF